MNKNRERGKIATQTKSQVPILLCEKCQLEVSLSDSQCPNCDTFFADQPSLGLEPMEVKTESIDIAQPGNSAAKESLEVTKPPIGRASFPSKKIIRRQIFLLTLLGLGALAYGFSKNLFELVSLPYLEKAQADGEELQLAILAYHKQYNRWPETLKSLSQHHHVAMSDTSYFVLSARGDFQQVMKSPFFLKGIQISWHRNLNGWHCLSRDLSAQGLNPPCVGTQGAQP